MLATAPARRVRFDRPAPRPAVRRRRWWPVVVAAALLGVVVVGHGCHGEHADDELSVTEMPRAAARLP